MIEEKVWNYILINFLGGRSDLDYRKFTLDKDTLDSLRYVKLMFFIENEFKISVDLDSASQEKLTSVEKIGAMIRDKLAEKQV